MMKPRHLEKFPCMMPRIGCHYPEPENERPEHKRLLVIGESHYLPTGSSLHLKPNDWYKQTEDSLNEMEKRWVSTEEIITISLKKGFKDSGHGIYRNIALELNNNGPGHKNPNQAIEHVAFCNFFLRPAIEGESLEVNHEDIVVAQDVLLWIIDEYRPELLAVTSRLAGKHAKPILESCGIPSVVTPHPTCAWWNKRAKAEPYNNSRGRDLFTDFIISKQWYN